MDLPRSNSTASASTGGDNYDDRIGDILNFHYAKLLKIENRKYQITIMMRKLDFFPHNGKITILHYTQFQLTVLRLASVADIIFLKFQFRAYHKYPNRIFYHPFLYGVIKISLFLCQIQTVDRIHVQTLWWRRRS